MSLHHYLFLSGLLFSIGIVGVLTRRNILMILLSLELILNAANLSFAAFSSFRGEWTGQAVVFFIMIVAAAEVAVGLAIVVILFRKTNSVSTENTREMKW